MESVYDTSDNYNKNIDNEFSDDFHISSNDLSINSNLKFYQGRFNLKTYSQFELGKQSLNNHSFLLNHYSNKSKTSLIHNSSRQSDLESSCNFFKRPNFEIGSYIRLLLEEGENLRNFNSTIRLNVNYKNFLLFSFGVTDWDVIKSRPNVLSLSTAIGKNFTNSSNTTTNLSFNLNLKYDIESKFLSAMQGALIVKNPKFEGIFELSNRNKLDMEIIKNNMNSTEKKCPVTHEVNILSKLIYRMCETSKLGFIFDHDINSKSSNTSLFLWKKLDRVVVKAELSSNNSLSLGLQSNLDGVKLRYGLRSTLMNSKHEIENTEISRYWVDYKFGIGAEFERI